MKSHMLLLRVVLNEMGTRCSTSTAHDQKTIMSRVEHEGLSFLTITLPEFCKDFEKSLGRGQVDSTVFIGYKKTGRLPRFLGGFVSRIFDTKTGYLLEEPCIDSIQAIRQICLLFSKVNLPCSDARVAKSLRGYIETEKEVRESDRNLEYAEMHKFQDMAILLWSNLFRIVDETIYNVEIRPKHGPGSTADRLLGNQKYNQTEWTERLEEVFSASEFLLPNLRHYDYDEPQFDFLTPEQERPVRVITVPKTLKAPRIIAIEPTCMQYVQQALMELIVETIERDHLLSRFIGFSDQEPNRRMAEKGSRNGSLATLDLSEASDRVSNQHVRYLLSYAPLLSEGVDACRSRKADVPGHGVIRLAKFASMGSALTFPIEAMVFLTIIFLGIQEELGYPLSKRDLLDYVGRVRVYGDDIIVPVEFVHTVVSKLEAFGLKVNAGKSFWTGKFRESCGREYFNGHDVSVVRVRELLPTRRQHAREIISTVSLRNQMYFAGNWETAKWLDTFLERLIPFPTVWPTSPGLGRHTFLPYQEDEVCPYLQKPLVTALVEEAKLPRDILDGPGALLKWFLKRGEDPFEDENHLLRAGRPRSVTLKTRKVSPY